MRLARYHDNVALSEAGGSISATPDLGLFSEFPGYRTPTDDDYRAVLEYGLVVLDTNVLLNPDPPNNCLIR
jgi:hypothetical protein